MNKTLNKTEQRYLSNFVRYGMECWREKQYWGYYESGSSPVAIGRAVESLIEKGLVEKIFSTYRATKSAQPYLCRYRESNVKGCQDGRIFEMDEDLGKCSNCDGLGVTRKPNLC